MSSEVPHPFMPSVPKKVGQSRGDPEGSWRREGSDSSQRTQRDTEGERRVVRPWEASFQHGLEERNIGRAAAEGWGSGAEGGMKAPRMARLDISMVLRESRQVKNSIS